MLESIGIGDVHVAVPDLDAALPAQLREGVGYRHAPGADHRGELGVPVEEVHGEIDLATTSELLKAVGIAGARLDGIPLACVDLRYAWFIDVTGVRILVEEAQAMRELGGELRLVIPEEGPVAHVYELLEVGRTLRLHHDLDLVGDEQAS